MRNSFGFIILIFFLSCSSSDESNTDPIDDEPIGTDVTLSFKWEKEMPTILPQAIIYDEFDRPYLYMASKSGGLLVLNDNDTEAPTQIANVPISELYMLHAMNVVQKGNYLYLALGDFFDGLNGSKTGLAIVNIENPTNPIVTAKWQSDTILGGSAVVAVEGNYAYLGAMEYGIFIFDVSNPTEIIEESNYTPDVNYPEENPQGPQIPNARGMIVVGNTMYLCYDAGGIRIIDITNKAIPTEIGSFHNFASIENTPKAYNNIIINGNLAYCAVDYCGFEIWDISTLGQEELVGWWNPWDCDTLDNLWFNSPGHTNQMIYDATNELIFVNSGRSDLSVIDVSNPENPIIKQSYGNFDDTLATWGMGMHNNDIYLLYIAAGVPLYSDWSGLKKLNWEFE
ncbi:LVIVD repeat-containing protein [Psychroserpens sp. MEBiC05023]